MDKIKIPQRVLLKVSGEALAKPTQLLLELLEFRNKLRTELKSESCSDDRLSQKLVEIDNIISKYGDSAKFAIDFDYVTKLCDTIAKIQSEYDGIKFGIVSGGGNFWRGAKNTAIAREHSDQIGMLATIMNAKALGSAFSSLGVESRVMTSNPHNYYAETYSKGRQDKHFSKNRIVIYAEGTGNPFSTTDSGAVLRAISMEADIVFKLTDVDYVFDSDPKKNPNAMPYMEIPYDYASNLGAMDGTAITMAKDFNLPIRLFNIDPIDENLNLALAGETGTLIGPEVRELKLVPNHKNKMNI